MTTPFQSVIDIAARVRGRTLSAVEVVRDSLARIERHDGAIKAFTQTFDDSAIERARRIDERVAAGHGDSLPLAGVPIAVKDNICLSLGKTTCASRMLEHYESPFTATAAQRLIDAGAVVVGKTNLDEFAMGSSTEHSCFGPTRNPWDVSRVPGGSSGGSAAAVAAGMAPAALGSDTGGSIRQPAALCGVVGVKPTYGRVSRYGLVAFASSLDQVGPMCANVADAALLLEVLSGHDAHDSTSALHRVPSWSREVEQPVDGLTLGVPAQACGGANHSEVMRVFEDAVAAYRRLGAKIVSIDLPMTDAGIAAYYIVATAEASSNLARYDGVRYGRRAKLAAGEGLADLYCRSRSEGFGDEVKRRIMLGTHVLSSGYYDAYYSTALKARRKILADFEAAFAAGCHAILMPTSPSPAFKIGAKASDPLAMYLEDVYTVGVNLAGLPAMSVPAGLARVDDGGRRVELPVGVQLIAPAFDESTMLRSARMLERELGAFAPPLSASRARS